MDEIWMKIHLFIRSESNEEAIASVNDYFEVLSEKSHFWEEIEKLEKCWTKC